MGKNVATNGFTAIGTCEKSTGTRVGLYLVDDQDSNVELLSHLTEFSEMLTQLALTFIQLATAMEVVAEVCHDAVDDEKTILPRGERLRQTTELLVLIFAVLCTDVEDVLVRGLWVNCALSIWPTVSCATHLLPKRSEICLIRSGRQVPSVSMTATRPSAPPFSFGS